MTSSRSGWSKETRSRQERGYGSAWDKLRLVILRRDNGLCQCDRCKGGALRVTLATEVHHIKAKAAGGTDDPGNLMSMSHDCHIRADAEAQGRKVKPKVKIGADGWPIAG